MVVRVKLKIKSKFTNRSVELVVLANGGAESPKPCVVVDVKTAEALNLWPSQGELYSIEEASTTTKAYLLPEAVKLELLDERGNTLSNVDADLIIQEGLHEPLITDITIDSLGIQVISFSKGLWRHKKDSPDTIRESAKHVQTK